MSYKECRTRYRQHLTPNLMTLNEHGDAVDVFCQKDGSLRAEHYNAKGNIQYYEEIPEQDLLALFRMYHDLQTAGEQSAFIFIGGKYKHEMKEYTIRHEQKGAVVA